MLTIIEIFIFLAGLEGPHHISPLQKLEKAALFLIAANIIVLVAKIQYDDRNTTVVQVDQLHKTMVLQIQQGHPFYGCKNRMMNSSVLNCLLFKQASNHRAQTCG